MTAFKLMNVLLADTEQFVNAPSLLCRSTRPWYYDGEKGAWRFEGPGTHDFMTFFNALCVNKWRDYTVAANFHLKLEIKGSGCIVAPTHANAFDRLPRAIDGAAVKLLASDEWQTVDVELGFDSRDVLLAYQIECEGTVWMREASYYSEVDESQIRPVELALCTTTFKKEEYILRNIELAREQILGSGEKISRHFTMHVVDNGRTLDAGALTGGGVVVHPNPNAGGAGGFARGMIEAMAQEPRATHVLLMDDDVLIAPESIIRTFNLLSLVSNEYVDAFVGGAMMNMEEPNVLFEDIAFMGYRGYCDKPKKPIHVDNMHNVVANASFDVPSYLPGCDDQNQRYQAWWYCAIPMTQIEKNGLPMPIFVRYDDVEYGLRCAPKIMVMNGICVWHMPFFMRYSAAQECYQTPRNALINSFASPNFAPLSDFEGQIRTAFVTSLKMFNYKDAELVLRGIEDFLKGPEWIMQPVAQGAFMDAGKSAEKYSDFRVLHDELAELGVSLEDETDWKIYRDAPISRVDRKLFTLSYNGQLGPDNYTDPHKVAVIDAFDFGGGVGRYYKASVIVAVDIPNGRAVIRHRDRARFNELYQRYQADLKELNARRDELKKAYAAAFPQMTSVEFWKGYLELEG